MSKKRKRINALFRKQAKILIEEGGLPECNWEWAKKRYLKAFSAVVEPERERIEELETIMTLAVEVLHAPLPLELKPGFADDRMLRGMGDRLQEVLDNG